MRNAVSVAVTILALAALPAVAQEDFFDGEVDVSLVQTDSDTISSKFFEYRDLSEGARLSFGRLQGKKGDFKYDLAGRNIGLEDQGYRLKLSNRTSWVSMSRSWKYAVVSMLPRVATSAWVTASLVS